ncbi:MAG: Druantia anti-phage system protein DruA [Solirubrobacteraceae bacterium]
MPPDLTDKQALRDLHSAAVAHRQRRAADGLRRHEHWLLTRLADNSQVDVTAFAPTLVPVERGSKNELLFRWAALHWSIPVSSGYGRRLRLLVVDQANEKLIGLIGLGDPVFALAARDKWVGWDAPRRRRMLHHVADAFVLGAVPPYSHLLAGKLVAMLAASNEVRSAWRSKYGGRTSLIAEEARDGRLAMITTTSALGRSSIYNRLRFEDGELIYERVGETRGSGEFHFSDGLHRTITDFALEFCQPTAKDIKWGTGFRNRREVVKKALPALGFSDRLLYHGVRRELFVCPMAGNARGFLGGASAELAPLHRPVSELADWFKRRWMHPRLERMPLPDWSPSTWRLYSRD